jgi:gliding motility-associated-like protein
MNIKFIMKTKQIIFLFVVLFSSFAVIANNNYRQVTPPPPPPSNDACANAIPLTVQATCSYTTYDNTGATATSGPPDPGCSGSTFIDVWFSIVVPANGSISVDTQTGAITDGGMAIYSGTCGSLMLLSCDDDGSANGTMPKIATFGLTPGSTVYVRFWEYGGNTFGTFGICVTSPTPPIGGCNGNPVAGDLCGAATPICNFNGYCGNTSGSYNPDEPGNLSDIFCGSIENNSWLKFIADSASSTFDVDVSNCTMDYGIQMEIYSTPDCFTFTSQSNCWNPGDPVSGHVTATGLVVGQTYYLMIDGNAGDICDYSITASSGVQMSGVISSTHDTLCLGQSTQVSVAGGSSYQWSPTTGLSNPTIANPIATPLTTTTYSVTVSGSNPQCGSATAQKTITVIGASDAPIFDNSPLCIGKNLSISTPINGSSYEWSGPNGFTSNLPNPVISNVDLINSGVYYLTVTLPSGCASLGSDTIVVNSIPVPVINGDSAVSYGRSITLCATAGELYLWNTGQTTQCISISPETETTYTVTVTTAGGCTASASKTITIIDNINIFIPNTFTPNGDGVNEVFRPYGKGFNPEGYELLIFDRWGKLVFVSNIFEKGWNGKVDGELANINGIFTYRITIYDLSKVEHKYVGSFSILGTKTEGN